MTRTEGWPVTIELIGPRLVGTGESMEALVAQLPEGRERIFEYLADEVLARQGPEEWLFLEQLAALRDFDLDDCSYMTGLHDCRQRLDHTAADATASITCCAKPC